MNFVAVRDGDLSCPYGEDTCSNTLIRMIMRIRMNLMTGMLMSKATFLAIKCSHGEQG